MDKRQMFSLTRKSLSLRFCVMIGVCVRRGMASRFNRMKHHRKAATRYDRLDETFLANLQLILIAIQLKNTSKTN